VTQWALTRDANGRITERSETVAGASTTYGYAYDSLGQLISVTKDGAQVESYEYGANGTRSHEVNLLRNITAKDYTYSREDHVISAGDTSYAFNIDGFLTQRTEGGEVTSYNYSSRGELSDVLLPNGDRIEYIYDPYGRRVAKSDNGGIVEKYL
jgi:YD repeat-containing protein